MIVRTTRGAYYILENTNKRVDVPGIIFVRWKIFRTISFSGNDIVPIPGVHRVSGEIGLTELASSLELFDLTPWGPLEIPGTPGDLPDYDMFFRFTEGSTPKIIQFVNVITGTDGTAFPSGGLSTYESLVDDGSVQVQVIPFLLRLDGALPIGDNVRIFNDPDA